MSVSGKRIGENDWDVENVDRLTRQERTVRGHRLSLIIVFHIVIQQILEEMSGTF